MSISDEYKSLRDEILMEYQKEVNLTTFVFTATAAIIGYGLTAKNPWVFLVPLALLTLLLFQLRNSLRSILEISVYIRVFIESNKDFGQYWETTIDALRDKLRNEKRFRSLTDVIFARFTAMMGAICIGLYFLFSTLWEFNTLCERWLVTGIAAILWLVISFAILRALVDADSGHYEKVLKRDFEEIYKRLKGK